MSRVYLSLGSNQAPGQHLRAAVAALQAAFSPVAVSPAYRSEAVGFVGLPFINLAVSLETRLSLPALKTWLHDLEDREGRCRSQPRFSNRTLDIDIVFVDQLIQDLDGIQIPRPEWRQAFVLKPLQDLDPAYREPVSGQTLAELWRQLEPSANALQPVDLMQLA